MICPFCQHEIAETWQPFFAVTDPMGTGERQPNQTLDNALSENERVHVRVEWMVCPNKDCNQILVRIARAVYDPRAWARRGGSVTRPPTPLTSSITDEDTVTWLAIPQRRPARPVDPLIPREYAEPFQQASLIIDDSAGMSAVLARKVLADLLDREGYRGYTVKEQIDKFIADSNRPTAVKEDLHFLREMADFAAHTKTDVTTGEVLETSREEAEWTLTVIESLFDSIIIGPARDAIRRQEMAAKMGQAGRKPIPPLESR